MRQTQLVMGMPITAVLPKAQPTAFKDDSVAPGTRSAELLDADAAELFAFFRRVDERFSPFKKESEVSRIGRGEITPDDASEEMRLVLRLCEETRELTNGYFDPWYEGVFDPSGLVKGWAVREGRRLLEARGLRDFSIEAGGDIEVRGRPSRESGWRIGIRDPFDPSRIVKIVALENRGIATSGLYYRGAHIYDPVHRKAADRIASLTVIAPDVFEADRIATPAFAMGKEGILFISSLPGFEGYLVDKEGTATYTEGFARYLAA